MLLYWISVIFGAIDIDILQFDVDIELDADADLELDGDADIQSGGALNGMMLYFNIGAVPVTVWLSFLIFSCWLLSILETYYLNPGRHVLPALIFAIPNLIAGMYIAKFATAPLKKVFEAMAPKNTTRKSLIGQRAEVVSSSIDHNFGQIQIKTDGAPLPLNARSEGDATILKGQTVVITRETGQGIFTVEPFLNN
jgi:membrane protein implicated in regulation of membrane protease activity